MQESDRRCGGGGSVGHRYPLADVHQRAAFDQHLHQAVDGRIGPPERYRDGVDRRRLLQRRRARMRMVDDLAVAQQLDAGAYIASRVPPLLAILRTALDVHLMPFEQYSGQIGDYADHKLWIGISTLTVRHVTVDPVLSARYAVTSTPDSERRAVPAAALSTMFGISATTVWRRCKALAAAGRIARHDDGWLIRKDQLREYSDGGQRPRSGAVLPPPDRSPDDAGAQPGRVALFRGPAAADAIYVAALRRRPEHRRCHAD